MRKLSAKQGRAGKFCIWASEKLEKWWVKYFLLPVFQTLPPALTLFSIDHYSKGADGASANVDDVAKEATESGKWDFLLDTIVAYPFWSLCVASIYLIFLNGAVAFIRDKADGKEEVDSKGLLALFETLEKVVGAKAARFGKYFKGLSTDPEKRQAAEIFDDITKPDQQITMLVAGLHGFFDSIDKAEVDFRVYLISVEDNVPVDFYYYYPESQPPKASIEDLRLPDGPVARAIRKKNLVIVQDVEVEQKNGGYIGTDGDQDDRSLLCYPVSHHYTDTIPYVIVMIVDKRDYFQTSKKQFYKWVFKHFAVRIALEHSLFLLKKRSQSHE